MAVAEGSALTGMAALLDRSWTLMGEAAADARRFDRETVRAVADVWDNNTFPFFRAATARTPWVGERRATRALRWMADLGPERWRWVAEQSARARHPAEGLLLPVPMPGPAFRDYRGVVVPSPEPLTQSWAAELASGYELSGAVLRSATVERRGDRLTAAVTLSVPRAFDTRADDPAVLALWLEGVEEVSLDSTDATGADLACTADHVVLGLGRAGLLRAARGHGCLDDPYWHQSAAGRRADALVPARGYRRRREPSPPRGRLTPAATAAARLLHRAVIEIRMVRVPSEAATTPVEGLCRAFAGSGSGVLDASRRGREAAFRELVEGWITRGGTELAPWFAARMREMEPGETRAAAREGQAAPPAPPTPPSGTRPSEAGLVLAEYRAEHAKFGVRRAATALALLAVPLPGASPEAPWRLRTVEVPRPERFRLHTQAFDGAGALRIAGRARAAQAMALHEGALRIAAARADGRG
ncbi:hypothetical protein AB0M28_15970 [Streptomyces sp. NPDC051940]|uniref:hypothetical protein n=1 Tax=Streptomyces sp. NPDC051940 TaxID=3155675 RepID=UPI00341EFCEB